MNETTTDTFTPQLPFGGTGGPVAPEQEEFSFAGDEGPKSKYDFAFDKDKAYNARTVAITQTTSNKTGCAQYVVEYLGLQGPIEGLKFKKYMPLTGKGLWITEKTLINVYGATKDRATKQVRFKKADVLGKLVGLKFATETYNGKTRNNISDVVPAVEVNTAGTGGPIPF